MDEKESLTEVITDILKEKGRCTIDEIFNHAGLGKGLEDEDLRKKKEVLRNAVIRLSTINKKKTLIKDGKRGRNYLYNLVENAESDIALLRQLYDIMSEDMEIREDRHVPIIKKMPIIEKIKERIQ